MATYLLRFDDVCPSMNWRAWDAIETELVRLGIRPLIAIVPDNRDGKLKVSDDRPDFWDRVRTWQARGWTIGLHGYQHVDTGGRGGILPSAKHSEFVGLSASEQEDRLRRGVQILAQEDVSPTVWVAPWHSFDEVTLSILPTIDIRIVSDGPGLYPYEDVSSMMWFPQQLWRFVRIPIGVLTVCHHINGWSDADVQGWLRTVQRFAPRIGDMQAISRAYAGRGRSPMDTALWSTARLGRRATRVLSGSSQQAGRG